MKDYSFENAETRYIIQTSDKRELNLYLNANKLALALYDLIEWRRAIYNGKTYGEVYHLYDGKLYSDDEWMKNYDKIVKPEDKDDIGFIKKGKVQRVYLEDDVEKLLGDKLEDINEFIYNYME